MKTIIYWTNRFGEPKRHVLYNVTYFYALNWWRESILECQGILSVDERRNSQLKLRNIVML